ncbi:phosphoadenosine phosphosulfate reductase family protein [Sarocladium implicatum]|nr:phosphoadenosine phosphosulfate reductase family protein [Sarocladium implicatum]
MSGTLQDVCKDLAKRVDGFLAEQHKSKRLQDVQEQLRISMGVVDEALSRYSLDEISLSYNGGKDCLVLLIMILACLGQRAAKTASTTTEASNGFSDTKTHIDKLQSVYIVSSHPFAEVDDFVETSAADYHLDVVRYQLPMKKGLECYLSERKSIKAIFVGTRRTDPHGESLTHFDPTDSGWPPFMRVHPVIDWHYAEIWTFIRHLNISYCPLYDQGYTSLGGTEDTLPNPQLKKDDGEGEGFRPAYELLADDEERLGRE